MKLQPFLKALKEMLCYHEALRRLGFRSEDIYAFYNTNTRLGPLVGIELQAQGKRFIASCGRVKLEAEPFHEQWKKLCAAFNDRRINDRDMEECWQSSFVVQNWEHFITRLMELGFTIPYVQARLAHPQGSPSTTN